MQTITAAIGIIFKDNKVLLSQRKEHQFMAGYWEFAGGKIKTGENKQTALIRELHEELSITVTKCHFLKTIKQSYINKLVILEVFIVDKYEGTIISKEGQNINFCLIDNVEQYKLLPTVKPLINTITLPIKYWITPDNHYTKEWRVLFEKQILNGIKMIQLRSKYNLTEIFIKNIYQKCQQNNIKLLLNIPNNSNYCNGYHLSSTKLMQTTSKQKDKIISASTHTIKELKYAEKLSLDFVSLSAIKKTISHPNAPTIGFAKAKKMITDINIPVYFLGGISHKDLVLAQKNYAHGIAGISKI